MQPIRPSRSIVAVAGAARLGRPRGGAGAVGAPPPAGAPHDPDHPLPGRAGPVD